MNSSPPELPHLRGNEPRERVVQRDGKYLIVPAGHQPPTDRCAICGKPASQTFDKKFAWHPPWVYVLILPGILIYAIVALCIQKRMTFQVGLCKEHARMYKTSLALGWFALIGGLTLTIYGFASDQPAVAGGAFSVGAILAIIAFIGTRNVVPVFIDHEVGKFSGCGQKYLDEIEETPSESLLNPGPQSA